MLGRGPRGVVGLALLATLSLADRAAAAEGFPLRAEFPQAPVISTAELHAGLASIIVVDVRSQLEFDVVHIKGAILLPVAKASFVEEVKKLRPKGDARKVAFYCNGHMCKKSYEAVELARAAGVTEVYVYDAGTFDWIEAYPELGTLMGKTPVVKGQVISTERFTARVLPYAEFSKRAADKDATVIDIREPMQREVVPSLPNLVNVYGGRLIENLSRGVYKGRPLLIFDAVGKQVQWLQYFLEQHGYKDYHFLDKGALAFDK